MRSTTTALVVDRTPLRLGMELALADAVRVCAAAESGEEAIAAARATRPELCLLAAELAGEQMMLVRSLLACSPNTAVIVVGGEPNAEIMLDAVRAGATGYVPGEFEAAGLKRVVAAVARGEVVIPRSMAHELVHELHASEEPLTRREAQVLNLVRRGQSTGAIADRLGIAPVTVRRHISELRNKLGVASRSDLVARSRRAGQTSPRRTA